MVGTVCNAILRKYRPSNGFKQWLNKITVQEQNSINRILYLLVGIKYFFGVLLPVEPRVKCVVYIPDLFISLTELEQGALAWHVTSKIYAEDSNSILQQLLPLQKWCTQSSKCFHNIGCSKMSAILHRGHDLVTYSSAIQLFFHFPLYLLLFKKMFYFVS